MQAHISSGNLTLCDLRSCLSTAAHRILNLEGQPALRCSCPYIRPHLRTHRLILALWHSHAQALRELELLPPALQHSSDGVLQGLRRLRAVLRRGLREAWLSLRRRLCALRDAELLELLPAVGWRPTGPVLARPVRPVRLLLGLGLQLHQGEAGVASGLQIRVVAPERAAILRRFLFSSSFSFSVSFLVWGMRFMSTVAVCALLVNVLDLRRRQAHAAGVPWRPCV